MEDLQKYRKEESPISLVPIDIIAAILGFVGSPDETTYLVKDDELIHGVILKLRAEYAILSVFAFHEGFSPLLERIFQWLQVARLLTMDNPDFRRYILKARAKRTMRGHTHVHLTEEGLSMVREIAEEIEKCCSASSQEL